MPVNKEENRNKHRDQDQYDPGAFGKFGHSENQHDHAGCKRAYAVNDHFYKPMPVMMQGRTAFDEFCAGL